MLQKLRKSLDYLQPSFYKFSEDSIRLVNVATELNQFVFEKDIDVLDLCAGSGICGADFAEKNNNAHSIQFIEKNQKFLDFLKENTKNLNPSCDISISDFKDHQGQYDLTLCNPPYFQIGKNRLGHNKDKNEARFMSEDDFVHLIEKVQYTFMRDYSLALILFREKEFKLPSLIPSWVIDRDKKTQILVLSKLDEDTNERLSRFFARNFR